MSEPDKPLYSGPLDLDLLRLLMNGTQEEVETVLAQIEEGIYEHN